MSNVWRPTKEQVEKLKGQLDFDDQYVFARKTTEKFRKLLTENAYVHALGAESGNQAIQMATAGLKAIYLSGWQTAANQNNSNSMFPDMGLYDPSSVPTNIKKINNAFQRRAQIDKMEGVDRDWLVPIVADGEHGFGSSLNTYELVKNMISAGVAGIHLENQAVSHVRRCGHLSGKVLVPALEHNQRLKAARLASEVCNVDTVIIARTDAKSAQYLTSDVDNSDKPFLTGKRTPEGLFEITGGLDMAISTGLQFAPYADMLWMEDSTPSLDNAIKFANAIHAQFPNKMLALNCSPSFMWSKHMRREEMSEFQKELAKHNYKFFFVTLAGFHSMNNAMFELATGYASEGMAAYSDLQETEVKNQNIGFQSLKHQSFVGTGYYDLVAEIIGSSISALENSTEKEQF